MPQSRPLWSERQGGSLELTDAGFHTLIARLLETASTGRLLEEAFGVVSVNISGLDAYFESKETTKRILDARRYDPQEFFVYRMGDPWAVDVIRSPTVWVSSHSRDRLFDLLELLYREAVSCPTDDGMPPVDYDRGSGQRQFREAANSVLGRASPPLEMNESGDIVTTIEEPFRRLVEEALPAGSPKGEVEDRVQDAIEHFRRRGGSAGDRRAAVRELADVLEFLRPQVKAHLLTEDEAALFQLANQFAIRHNKRETRRDFDQPAFLAWAFYVYLATIRLVLELRKRES